MALAEAIRDLQARMPAVSRHLDADLVSAYINASLFAFGTMAPWLMASVGLAAEDFEARQDEIVEITVRLISMAAGSTGEP